LNLLLLYCIKKNLFLYSNFFLASILMIKNSSIKANKWKIPIKLYSQKQYSILYTWMLITKLKFKRQQKCYILTGHIENQALIFKLFNKSHMRGKRTKVSKDSSPTTCKWDGTLHLCMILPASHPWLKCTLSASSCKTFEQINNNCET
jgi:hypothetical protein